MSGWWVAAGGVVLLLVLAAGAWLVTVIVRRANDRAVDSDTQPLDLGGQLSGPREPDADGDAQVDPVTGRDESGSEGPAVSPPAPAPEDPPPGR